MLEDKQLELEERSGCVTIFTVYFPMFLPVSSENHRESHKAVGKD
jgi:hypothetical protein